MGFGEERGEGGEGRRGRCVEEREVWGGEGGVGRRGEEREVRGGEGGVWRRER